MYIYNTMYNFESPVIPAKFVENEPMFFFKK